MLYLHVPFCAAKCAYCSFYSVASRTRVAEVLGAMEAELMQKKSFFGGVPLRTIYVGGGTPSFLSIQELGRLLDKARQVFDCSLVEEQTVEANPEQLSAEYLTGLRGLGFDRLSIGVQSFADERLKLMRRRHTATEAQEAFARARAAGFANLSIDLIYGFADMGPAEWAATIDQAILLAPEHISSYHLSIEPRTLFARRGVEAADDERSTAQYAYLCENLSAAGYVHYEISNWAKPTRHSRHNSGYWTGEPYLGIGPSAHSYDGAHKRSWNTAQLTDYKMECETLTTEERHNEYVMLALRRAQGVDPKAYAERFGQLLPEKPWLEPTSDGHYRISEADWLIADGLIAELFIESVS